MSESPEHSAAFRALIEHLDTKGFSYTPYPKENRITLSMSGKNANYRFIVRLTHAGDYLQITAYYPFFVRDEKLRSSVAELIIRANYNMLLGKFEMDIKDGEVCFHITHVIGELGLTDEMMDLHFMTAYFTADRYFPAFMQHLHAGYTPEDAVFHAELDVHAAQVEEDPKKGKSKPVNKNKKASESSTEATTEGADATSPPPNPAAKKAHKKKNGGESPGQGELPI